MSVFRLLFIISVFTITYLPIQAQITIDFNASATEGCGSLQVNFCDNSTSTAGDIIAWSWNLGGVTSNSKCPGRIFGTPNSYTICLSVTDAAGNTASNCEDDFITVLPLPEPDFTADVFEGCVPLTVEFSPDFNTSDINEYEWNVSGSTGTIITSSSSPTNATSTYSIPDQYDISLKVTDDKGCANTLTKENYITAFGPTPVEAHALQTFGCHPPFQVNFVNDNPDPALQFQWDFGNGQTFNGTVPPPINYNDYGKYTVSLFGYNSETTCWDTLILEDYIQVGYDVTFSYTPDKGCEDLSVTFTDLSPNAANVVTWDFGDGLPMSNDPNPTHVFENPGFYSVTLSRNIGGCENSWTDTMEIEVFGLPDVSYTNDNTLGCTVPHEVNFTGISSDATSWLWDFGDGTTSTEQNPNHVYTAFGNYLVTLTVMNANGCENIINTSSINIVETQALLSNYQFNGCSPVNVNLSDNSSTVVPITSWSWEIVTPSGILTSTDPIPNFSIPDTGCFDVTLEIVNALGCSHVNTFQDVICVGIDPVANFEANPFVTCVDAPVQFIDLSEDFADTWQWDFGNGSQSTEQSPSTFYTDIGFYDVTLVTSFNGCEGSLTLTDYIEVTEPISKFEFTQQCEIYENVTFTNTSIGADSLFWDFGVDGVSTDTSSLFNPSFSFPSTGTYIVTLKAFNFATGCEHESSATIYIHDPLSSFVVPEVEGCVPFAISLQNNSEFGANFQWSSPTGAFSNAAAANPTITFGNSGIHSDIQLIVTDVNGCRDTTVFTDDIFANEVIVDFDYTPQGGCVPLEVEFTDQSQNVFANNVAWDWTYGSGLGTATGINPDFSFDIIGLHDVTLVVTDDWGCTGSFMIPQAVDATSPSANFSVDSFSCTAYPISFSNISTGKNLTYLWEFGDGTTSTEENPSYTYPMEGVYSPCLTVTDLYGCISTFCLNNEVLIQDPVADFSLDTNYAACPLLVVNFNNNSLNAASYLWDFGDGSATSTAENPAHTYAIPGVYDVTLIATTNANCVDTFIVQDLVILDGPLGSFTFDMDTTCVPRTVTFSAQSQDQLTYVWDYGDGSPLDTVENVTSDVREYVYEVTGTYSPKLAIIDANGCKRVLESPTSFFIPELSLDFQASSPVMCDFNDPVTFLNLISSTGPINNFKWIFEGGDPDTSFSFEPTINFDQPGLYDVTLIAENAYCADTLVREDFIRIGDTPAANFIASEVIGCEPLEVTFTDVSTVVNGNINQWHWKFGDGFESFLVTPTHTFLNGSNFEVELVITTDVGCTDTIRQTINVVAQPNVEVPTVSSICIGETTQLEGMILSDTSGVTYFWENSTTLSCTNCLNPIADPVDTTTYTFVVINAEGCETRTDVTVDVRPFEVPTIVISNDTIVCANEPVQLFVDGGDNIFSYNWNEDAPGLTCYSSCFNPIAEPTTTTAYSVTVTNVFGCSSQDEVLVEVRDQFVDFVGVDRTICEGGAVGLSMDSGFGANPIWLQANGLDCSACYEAEASPTVTTDFIAQLTTDEGCEIIDSVRVHVIRQSDIDAGENMVLCRGASTVLEGQFTYDDPSVNPTYTWFPAIFLDQDDILNPEASPSSSINYRLTVEDDLCILRDSMRINVVEKTEIEAIGGVVCLGDSIELQIEGYADQFTWSPALTLSDSTAASPLAFPETSTEYKVIAQLSVCEPDTTTVKVEVDPIPEASIPQVYNFFEGQNVELGIENGSIDYLYQWFPADGLSCTTCPNPIASVTETTEYSVTIVNQNTGCFKVENTILQLTNACTPELVGIPNVFTPNGDNENDVLEIKYSSSLIIDNFTFRVFDRWGSLVFETNDPLEYWDGTSRGQNMASGVYIYMMEFPCQLDGSIVRKSGDITIYR